MTVEEMKLLNQRRIDLLDAVKILHDCFDEIEQKMPFYVRWGLFGTKHWMGVWKTYMDAGAYVLNNADTILKNIGCEYEAQID